MIEFKVQGEYIKLGQVLKACGLVQDGVESKFVIQDGLVQVDHETDTRRGRKLFGGEIVTYQEEIIKIIK